MMQNTGKPQGRRMKFHHLETPSVINFGSQTTLHGVEKTRNNEFESWKCWSRKCSELLCDVPSILLQCDRLKFALGNAFGLHHYKIACNPLIVLSPQMFTQE